MEKILIVVGHSRYDGGAINPNNKQSEYNYNIGVKEYLKKELEKDYLVEVYNREKNRVEQFSKINELKPDLIISLHCNAGANIEKKIYPSGTEVLHWFTSVKGKKLATILTNNISKLFGLKNRGTKSIKYGDRGAGILEKTNAPCVIIEPFFIDNDLDLSIGTMKILDYAKTIKTSIDEYYKN